MQDYKMFDIDEGGETQSEESQSDDSRSEDPDYEEDPNGSDQGEVNENAVEDDDGLQFGDLEGYDNLRNDGDSDSDDNEENLVGVPREQRPAHYSRTTKAAARSALRTQANESETFFLIEDGGDGGGKRSNTRVPGTFGRRDRDPGDCLPAYSKKITVDLDSDDELIMTMRDKGYRDQAISDRLAKEGRVKYNRQSIATRYIRIKKLQAQHVDIQLEDGYKEWQFEEDRLLLEAYALADREVSFEIERARAWRFKKVSDFMRRLDKDAIFSDKACRERYFALMNGTAQIPLALVDEPEARLEELEAFRLERSEIREAQRYEKEQKLTMAKRIKDEARLRNAQKAEATALRREKKQQERAERSMKRAAQHQIKLQRAQENKTAKEQRLASIRRQKAAEQEREAKRIKRMNPYLSKSTTLNLAKDFKNITPDMPDPRGYLSMTDLKTLCQQRNLPCQCKSVDAYVQRLRDADDVWTSTQLKTLCRAKGLNQGAPKHVLKYQLALAEARSFAGFEETFAAAQADEGGHRDDEVPQTDAEYEEDMEDNMEDDMEE